MSVTGSIHSFESFGTLDGPGLRSVIFLQGCSLRCRYCHNPDTWNLKSGKQMDSEEVIKEVLSYKHFIAKGGVTISGGEPLKQPMFALELLKRLKQEGLHTALDTAGSVPLEISKPVLDAADLILLDIKSLDDKQCFSLTGMGNAHTLATLAYCQATKKPVWLRHVLVPGWTLQKERLEDLASFLEGFDCIEQVELLPYHRLGQYKWEQLKLQYTLKDVPEPSEEDLRMARSIFEEHHLKVLMTSFSQEKEIKVG
ncbi:pyruvate formate-lyase-activating protein [Sphaerochaeta sp.]|uniref:pyruvate formate-lyase-activating protein n=1 Tax=Sphaerochaeta sp. TaxID=1972642 RepID=UPI002FCC9AE2